MIASLRTSIQTSFFSENTSCICGSQTPTAITPKNQTWCYQIQRFTALLGLIQTDLFSTAEGQLVTRISVWSCLEHLGGSYTQFISRKNWRWSTEYSCFKLNCMKPKQVLFCWPITKHEYKFHAMMHGFFMVNITITLTFKTFSRFSSLSQCAHSCFMWTAFARLPYGHTALQADIRKL